MDAPLRWQRSLDTKLCTMDCRDLVRKFYDGEKSSSYVADKLLISGVKIRRKSCCPKMQRSASSGFESHSLPKKTDKSCLSQTNSNVNQIIQALATIIDKCFLRTQRALFTNTRINDVRPLNFTLRQKTKACRKSQQQSR